MYQRTQEKKRERIRNLYTFDTYFRKTSAASAHEDNALECNPCRYKYPP